MQDLDLCNLDEKSFRGIKVIVFHIMKRTTTSCSHRCWEKDKKKTASNAAKIFWLCINRSETGGLMDSSPENVKYMMANICHQRLDMFKPALLLGAAPDQWLTACFWCSVPDSLSKALWLRAPGASPDPCQLKTRCLRQNFVTTGLNNLFYSLPDLYCYSCYETLTHGSNFSTGSMDCLCFSLPGTLKDFYFFNKIEYSHAWAGVRIS